MDKRNIEWSSEAWLHEKDSDTLSACIVPALTTALEPLAKLLAKSKGTAKMLPWLESSKHLVA